MDVKNTLTKQIQSQCVRTKVNTKHKVNTRIRTTLKIDTLKKPQTPTPVKMSLVNKRRQIVDSRDVKPDGI